MLRTPTKVKLLCDPYTRFFYPSGLKFYSTHVHPILQDTNNRQMTPERMKDLLNIVVFNQRVKMVLDGFSCTEQQILTLIKQDVDNGRLDWMNEDPVFASMTIDDKITTIIREDNEYNWWYSIGTGKSQNMRKNFERRIISTMANTILTAALSIMEDSPHDIDKEEIGLFLCNLEENYNIIWVREIIPYLEKVRK